MTTETTCLSSVWQTDEEVHNWLALHGRGQDYCQLNPQPMAYYDGCISVDLSAIKPMIALPFHPSNVYKIDTLNQNLTDILREIEIESERVAHGKSQTSLLDKVENGRLKVQRGLSRAVLAVTTKTSSRRRMHCAVNPVAMTPSRWQFTRHHSRCLWISPKRCGSRFDWRRRNHQNRVLRPMLWRGRYANQQRFEYSPHHA